MRKHELAETNNGEIVYRLKDGNIVNWVTAVTNRAEEILGIIQEDKDDIHSIVDGLPEEVELARAQIADMASSIYGMRDEVQADVQTVSGIKEDVIEIKDDVLGLKDDVIDIKEEVLASVQDAEDSANLAEKWANYMEGTVDGNEYSAKYYATSISGVSDHVDQTAEDIEDYIDEQKEVLQTYVDDAESAADRAEAVTGLSSITTIEIDTIVAGGGN